MPAPANINNDIDFEDFDELKPWTKGIKVNGRKFLITKADGYASEQYKTAQISGSVFNQDSKNVTIGKLGAVENVLVGNCAWIYDEETKTAKIRAGYAIVVTWPSELISSLYDEIKEKSGLNEVDKAESAEEIRQKIADLQTKLNDFEQDRLGNSQPGTMFG